MFKIWRKFRENLMKILGKISEALIAFLKKIWKKLADILDKNRKIWGTHEEILKIFMHNWKILQRNWNFWTKFADIIKFILPFRHWFLFSEHHRHPLVRTGLHFKESGLEYS